MGKPTLPIYFKQKHTSAKDASVSGQVVIYAVQVHANGAVADVELSDALTDGSDDLMYSVLDGADPPLYDYTDVGGVIFKTGLSVDISSGAVFIWTDRRQVAT
jgi:hypothetical protein